MSKLEDDLEEALHGVGFNHFRLCDCDPALSDLIMAFRRAGWTPACERGEDCPDSAGGRGTMSDDTSDKLANRWRFLPEAEAISGPQGGFCAVYRDRWWVCHPEHGLTFFWSRGVKGLGSPQCNASKDIAVRLGKPVWAVLKFLPVVFVPISLADYQ